MIFHEGDASTEEIKAGRTNENLVITFSVAEIEKVFNEINSKSVEIIQPLRTMPYGKELNVADPDGNILAFLEEA